MSDSKQLAHEIAKLIGVSTMPYIINPLSLLIDSFMQEHQPVATLQEANLNVTEAVNILTDALENDQELYIAYHSNIAMAFKDEISRQGNEILKTDNGIHKVANDAASRFLRMFIESNENIFISDQYERKNDLLERAAECFTAIVHTGIYSGIMLKDWLNDLNSTYTVKPGPVNSNYWKDKYEALNKELVQTESERDNLRKQLATAQPLKKFSENDLSTSGQSKRIKSLEKTVVEYTYLLRKAAELMEPSGDVEPCSLQACFSQQIKDNLEAYGKTDTKEENDRENEVSLKKPSRVRAQSLDFIGFLDYYAANVHEVEDWRTLSLKVSPEALNEAYVCAVEKYNEQIIIGEHAVYSDLENNIIRELERTLQIYGFGSDYLAPLGSYAGNAESAKELLLSLKYINDNFSRTDAHWIYMQMQDKYNFPDNVVDVTKLGYEVNQDAATAFMKELIHEGYAHAKVTAWNIENGLRVIRYTTDITHLSVSHPHRQPTYEELQWCRDTFGRHIEQLAVVFKKDQPVINTFTLFELIYK